MFIFFTNLDLFCIDNARVIYRKIRYLYTQQGWHTSELLHQVGISLYFI